MLFKLAALARIQAGEITMAFRRWRRPTVAAGGTLKTAVGVLAIEAVERIDEGQITPGDAARAGFADVGAVKAELAKRPEGDLHRITFRLLGPDPRIELRERIDLAEGAWEAVERRLQRMDAAARSGPWTRATLEAIREGEGVRAGDLASALGQEKETFKVNVRKLKNLGLTESLGTGYRISPRGREVLGRLREERG